MSDIDVRRVTSNFAALIRQTDVYREYDFQKNKLKRQPDLFRKVNEYRRKNYDLQQEEEGEALYEKMEQFEKEWEIFRENPLVDDFLKAELAFCRMMQDINVQLTAELDFE